jgi:hypothetical protein
MSNALATTSNTLFMYVLRTAVQSITAVSASARRPRPETCQREAGAVQLFPECSDGR